MWSNFLNVFAWLYRDIWKTEITDYAKLEKDSNMLSAIPLPTLGSKKSTYLFVIDTGGTQYHLHVETMKQMNQWINSLNKSK
jgi:hypothetical protein